MSVVVRGCGVRARQKGSCALSDNSNRTHRRENALLRIEHPLAELLGVVRVMEAVHRFVDGAQEQDYPFWRMPHGQVPSERYEFLEEVERVRACLLAK